MKFESLNLVADLLKGIDDAGFERCTPIQEQALPECLAGKDVIAQSQTGSGKTAVFLLTIFNKLVSNGYSRADKPKALIMVPTRELAGQVEQDAAKLGKYLPVKTVALYGGVQYDRQVNALKKGVDVVVATPGRMIDLYKSKILSLNSIETFIIDEADRMFDMGFAPDIRYIAGRLPKDRPRQTLLFSATIDSNVQRLSSTYMAPNTVEIEIEPEQVTVESIDQKIVYVSNEEKLPALMALISREDAERVVIFVNMKRTAEMLGFKLNGNGFPVEVLTGDVSQSKRERIIRDVKSGKVRYLVATDVAARGLHIEGVTHVINYDLPEEAANYVHRIGRTARAGKSGKAYSLACEKYVLNLPEIEKFIEHKVEKEWIEESEMVADKAGHYSGRRRRGPGPSSRKSAGKAPAKRQGRPARAPRRGGRTRPENAGDGAQAGAPEGGGTADTGAASRPQRTGQRPGRKRSGRKRPFDRKRSGAATKPGDTTGSQVERAVSSTEGSGEEKGFRKEGAGGTGGRPRGEKKAGPQRRRRRPGQRPKQGARRERRPEESARPEAGQSPVESRLDFYKNKYSESFPAGKTAAAEKPASAKSGKKEGVLKKVLNVFRKK